jgi:hypothetical protein
MPNRTIYIKNADIDKWESITDKPAFIHLALNDSFITLNNMIAKKKAERK